eukprot:3136750-Amphidinium_carterae.1
MAWNASQVVSLMNSLAALQQTSGRKPGNRGRNQQRSQSQQPHVRPGRMLLEQVGIALLVASTTLDAALLALPASETSATQR